MPEFKPGDRVLIVGNHPWKGRAGTLRRRIDPPKHGLDWIVAIDEGYGAEACVEISNLRGIKR